MNRRTILRTNLYLTLALLNLCLFVPTVRADTPETALLRTVAEKSDYQATSRHEEVVDFCER